MTYKYVFTPITSHYRGEHWLRPGGSAMASLGLGLAPTANLPCSGLSDVPLFLLRCVNVDVHQPWMVEDLFFADLSPQLTAAAGNYDYVHPRNWQEDVAMAPGGRHRYRRPGIAFPSLFTLTLLIFLLSGHWSHWAGF